MNAKDNSIKSPQVSRTLLSILAVLNNAVVWMDSTRQPTSKSFSLFKNPLLPVPKAPITIGKIVTFMFHSFFQFPIIIVIINNNILIFGEFFTPALADGFPLGLE